VACVKLRWRPLTARNLLPSIAQLAAKKIEGLAQRRTHGTPPNRFGMHRESQRSF
jgi:hypothetical protein